MFEPQTDWNDALRRDLDELQGSDPRPGLTEKLGEWLRRCLEGTSWRKHARAIASAHDNDQSVFITLRLNAAELYTLPWELLTIREKRQHLGALNNALIRYEWPDTENKPEPAHRPEGGRVLLAWSAAGGVVPHAQHASAIEDACSKGFPEHENDCSR